MEVSPNFLITKRMINNTAFSIVSAVLGSMAGLLAVFGKSMKFLESSIVRIKEKKNSTEKIQKIKEKRKELWTSDERHAKKEFEIRTNTGIDIII